MDSNSFMDLGISVEIVNALKMQNIEMPTEIQKQSIPVILDKKDVIVQSETGSGKTFAYLLPILSTIDCNSKNLQSIVLAPTHELCIQIENQLKILNISIPFKSMTIIGSANISRQIEKLKQKPNIIVGSAKRIVELISKKKISCHNVKTVVLDEADKMLDSRNVEYVKSIVNSTLKQRQIIMVSAMMDERTIKTAYEISKETVIVKTNTIQIIPDTIEHMYFVVDRRDKFETLRKILRSESPKKSIVFIDNPNSIDEIVEKLKYHKFNAIGIYALNDKLERKKAMDSFKSGSVEILVSSDLGSRGIDIDSVTHILNLDIPKESNFYLHRAGRTGRAGKKGYCISIATESEQKILKRYENKFNISIKRCEIKGGKIIKL